MRPALYCGYLIFKSGYFSKLIGVLLQLAGCGYLMGCSAALFTPALAEVLIPGILLLPLVGELSFCLWLLIKGVNGVKWQARLSQGAAE